ncbi:phytanoyl-CoA dioxygenase family protein [Sphingorhabdus sp.]|jgi:phytanoyl-CoA hydroxylase|uniref:phytanoyl-CoA dioxygenase family protein n=1 Tax=Sphingorhabdus sp. TaxID=1902408 RepID=UPI0037CC6DF3
MANLRKKLENKFLSSKSNKLDQTEMWFLTCPEDEITNDPSIDDLSKRIFLDLRKDGFAIIRNNLPHDLCDNVIQEFNSYCRNNMTSQEYRGTDGLHSRLALFHYESKSALQVGMAKNTVHFIEHAFRSKANIVGSLFFEKGSTQEIHRDTPAFFTNPLNHFFGVWNALEDIKDESGELCYYRGGHRIARDGNLYDDPGITIENYFARVEQECIDSGLTLEKYTPRKGDTLIWLPELPHGGSARKEGLSRKSMVFHYIPRGVPIHGVNEFFDKTKSLYINENYSVRQLEDARMIDMGRIRFYHNHREGNFKEG